MFGDKNQQNQDKYMFFYLFLLFISNLQYQIYSKMEATTQQKQKYLRQQILSQYDPDQFVDFVCKDLNIKQLDVQHWDMKKIQEIVMKFKQYIYYSSNKNQVKKQPIQKERKKKVKIQYQKNGVFDYEFEQVCKCTLADILIKNLEITVPLFEIKKTQGLFLSIGSKTQIWYTIKSNFSDKSVKRLEEDFLWLSDYISRLFPLLAIPELPILSKQIENNHEQRRVQLEQYLQILARREELKSSHAFTNFLSLPYDKLDRLKKSTESMGFGKVIQGVKNEKGEIKVQYSNKNRNFAINTQLYNRRSQILHESIGESLSKVVNILFQASQQIDKIVNYFAQLHESYHQLANKSPETKVNAYNDTLIELNNLFNLISKNFQTNAKIITEDLKDYFKITINYDKSIIKLNKMLLETEKDYLNAKINLFKRKERLYSDVSKWQVDAKFLEGKKITKQQAFELMLPRQTSIQTEQRLWLTYLYNNYSKQFQKYLKFQVERYVKYFNRFSQHLWENNQNLSSLLKKFNYQTQKINE